MVTVGTENVIPLLLMYGSKGLSKLSLLPSPPGGMSPVIISVVVLYVQVPEMPVTVYGPPEGVEVDVKVPDALEVSTPSETLYEKPHVRSACVGTRAGSVPPPTLDRAV